MKLKHWFITLILSAIVSISVVWLYHKNYATRVVAIDMKPYVEEQKKLFLEGKIDEKELKKNFSKLERVVSSLPRNKIAIMKEVVVANAEIIKP